MLLTSLRLDLLKSIRAEMRAENTRQFFKLVFPGYDF